LIVNSRRIPAKAILVSIEKVIYIIIVIIIICLILAAEVEFLEDECGKLLMKKVIRGQDSLPKEGESLVLAIKQSDCDYKLKNNGKFCILADKSALGDKLITLDKNSILLNGQCDINCSPSFRGSNSEAIDKTSSEELNSRQNGDASKDGDQSKKEKSGPERSVGVSTI